MKNILTVTLCLLLLSPLAEAQKYKQGTITFLDGTTKEGLVKPPNDPGEKNIEYKANESSKKEKYSSEEVTEVLIVVNDTENRFIRGKIRRPKTKEPASDADYKVMGPLWMVEMVKGPATLYAAGPLMKISKDGRARVELNWNGNGVPPDIYFYGKKGDELPTWMAFYSVATMGQMKAFTYWASRFFSDYPELAARINAKEFEVSQIADVFEEYNQWVSSE